ncbi:hypothetical protein DUNSADRAFT_16188 [Dunaliella salina]|uniref:HMG box domain-containing protein n=1 Tax=Dunaliella salina TaxID=3046 RepID=A0ABQ7G471_DUNSA|nr:hypothetical protein DUNSADRAFT_16188 [Dunaliella salina]|eukprot:KAF5829367.1 hypothetical protein DUNSADRAFT_16188 [Dunaliella salina]
MSLGACNQKKCQQDQPDEVLHEVDAEDRGQGRPAPRREAQVDEQPGSATEGVEQEQEPLELDEAALLEQLHDLEDDDNGSQQEQPDVVLHEVDAEDADKGRPVTQEEAQPAAEVHAEQLQEPGADVPMEGPPDEDQARDVAEALPLKESEAVQGQGHLEGQAPGTVSQPGSGDTPIAAEDAQPESGGSGQPEAPQAQPPATASQAKLAAQPVKKRAFIVQGDAHKPAACKDNATPAETRGPAIKSKLSAPAVKAPVAPKAAQKVEAPKKAAATAVAAPKKAAVPAPAKPEATAAKPRIVAPKKAETAAKADAHGAAKGGGGGGGGKGTTAKEAKGDKRPRAPSAYSLFADQMRPSLKAERPTATFGEVVKQLGELWKAASAEEKKAFEDKAAAEKEAVKSKQVEWDAAHPDGAKTGKKRGPNNELSHTLAAKKAKGSQPAAPPPKPKSAYQIFSTARRPECMQDNPGASAMEIAQLLEGEWRNMTEEEQAPYQEDAKVQRRTFMEATAAQLAAREEEQEEGGQGEEEDLEDAVEGGKGPEDTAQGQAAKSITKGAHMTL